MFGYYGPLTIHRATTSRKSGFWPVAEADVSLGIPSLQLVSRKLKDFELEISLVGPTAAQERDAWEALAESREPQLLTVAGKPLGYWLITANVEEIIHAIDSSIDYMKLRITFKEQGAFLWVGNYPIYEPPPTVRRTAEAGISGLSQGVLSWLKK
ncbi:MAG: hypothetical protein DI617_08415 [Streptococcus pyogenes]|nr:MAG: hypothetical protein DI617_08415 [Streptococcus pyogenes]